ncbi:unnamed protein product, partial [Iphiclides podalirius]
MLNGRRRIKHANHRNGHATNNFNVDGVELRGGGLMLYYPGHLFRPCSLAGSLVSRSGSDASALLISPLYLPRACRDMCAH